MTPLEQAREMLTVEQVDRDAAVDFAAQYLFPSTPDIRSALAQAFARHRIAALRAASMYDLQRLGQDFDARDERVKALEDHIRYHITYAETRIEDGIALGATVWRIALEDIARENRAVLKETQL